MIIEKVKVLTTLKAGDQVWKVGQIVTEPIPPDLLSEVKRGLVEVLSERHETKSFAPINEKGTTSTSATAAQSAPEPAVNEQDDLFAPQTKPIEKSEPVFKDEIANTSRKAVGRPKKTTTTRRRRKK